MKYIFKHIEYLKKYIKYLYFKFTKGFKKFTIFTFSIYYFIFFKMSESCAICYEKSPNVLLNPCLHRDFCSDCVAKLRDPKICPVCRMDIQSVVPIPTQPQVVVPAPPPCVVVPVQPRSDSPPNLPHPPSPSSNSVPVSIPAVVHNQPRPSSESRPTTPPMMTKYWRRFENDSPNVDNEDAIVEFSTSRLFPQDSKLVIFKQYNNYILGDIYYIPQTKEALYIIIDKNSYPMRFCVCIVQIHSPSAADRIATPVNITIDLPRLFTPHASFYITNLNHRFIGHFRNKVVIGYIDGEYTVYQMLHYTPDEFYAARCLEFRNLNMQSYIFNNLLVIKKNAIANASAIANANAIANTNAIAKEQRKKIYVYDILTLEELNRITIPTHVDFECYDDVIHYFETREDGRRRAVRAEYLVR